MNVENQHPGLAPNPSRATLDAYKKHVIEQPHAVGIYEEPSGIEPLLEDIDFLRNAMDLGKMGVAASSPGKSQPEKLATVHQLKKVS